MDLCILWTDAGDPDIGRVERIRAKCQRQNVTCMCKRPFALPSEIARPAVMPDAVTVQLKKVHVLEEGRGNLKVPLVIKGGTSHFQL